MKAAPHSAAAARASSVLPVPIVGGRWHENYRRFEKCQHRLRLHGAPNSKDASLVATGQPSKAENTMDG